MIALALCAALLAAAPATGEARPSESDLFGASDAPSAATPARPAEDALFGDAPAPQPAVDKGAEPPSDETREASLFGGKPRTAQTTDEAAPEDPLKMGGQLYMLASTTGLEDSPPKEWLFSNPTLLDVFFDARPNDRVRGFALGRLHYDPTVVPASTSGLTSLATGSSKQLYGQLDQLWFRFDVGRSVFVTAGKQHVKWGPARFWNPTDFLHNVHRDPLAQFDARTGTTMLKLHVPWEKEGWNFYGVALLEGAPADHAAAFGGIGAAARAEVVLGGAEFGLDAVVQNGHKPKLGFDVSAGLGPFDVYGEVALRRDLDRPVYGGFDSNTSIFGQMPSTASLYNDLKAKADGGDEGAQHAIAVLQQQYPGLAQKQLNGTIVGATLGANWSVKYNDEDVLTLGGEYYYNSAGYTDSSLYQSILMKDQTFDMFYLGKHYLGLYAVLPSPGRWENTTFTLSNLVNLSDKSGTVRLDYSLLALTHLRIEAFGSANYGTRGGSFRFGLKDFPVLDPNNMATPPRTVTTTMSFQVGVGLRINI